MRVIAPVASALAALAMMAAASTAFGADLSYRSGSYAYRHVPGYFGKGEPWATMDERPPRKGEWFYTEPLTPAVNFLVPLGQRWRYQKPAPWTPAWYSYCASRWPSFNPRTGTIKTPDGVRMCL
ncbi:BA14K family protein [Acuticoccus sp. 2012]|uniref:Lectin-like protein BA14k n=1 Tax=Acuticoccus mangrovi TaxID=2796142 RepID=A0A934INK8_9HYPH|nr:BA14K family protein [Acuticoccus mangrovi]MBJ3775492.1 BA14K family protein [Acuticoccus mangrovi]